jgi:hypothetical protein
MCEVAPWIVTGVEHQQDGYFDCLVGHWTIKERCPASPDGITRPAMLYKPKPEEEAYKVTPGREQWWLLVDPAQLEVWRRIGEYFLRVQIARPMFDVRDVAVGSGTMSALIYDVDLDWFVSTSKASN